MSAACPEYAFEIEWRSADATVPGADWQTELDAVLEARGLAVSYIHPNGRRFLVVRDGGQASEGDRDALRAWGERQRSPGTVIIGPLIDLHEFE